MNKPQIKMALRVRGFKAITNAQVDILYYLMRNPGANGQDIAHFCTIPSGTVYRVLSTFREKDIITENNVPVGEFALRNPDQEKFKLNLILPQKILDRELPPNEYRYAHTAAYFAENPDPEKVVERIRQEIVSAPLDLLRKIWEAQDLLALFAIIGGNLENWRDTKGEVSYP